MPCLNPFPLPDPLDRSLQAVVSLWKELRRAENGMPFADDLKFSDLPKLSAKPFVLSVFTSPERFRFEYLDKSLQGAGAAGGFIDGISADTNFSYLRAQSSATLEAAEPTFFRLIEDSGRSIGRLLLPMWGNGEVNTLLGAVNS